MHLKPQKVPKSHSRILRKNEAGGIMYPDSKFYKIDSKFYSKRNSNVLVLKADTQTSGTELRARKQTHAYVGN